MHDPLSESDIQRHYYSSTASEYDRMHGDPKDEHGFALAFLVSMIDFFEISSVLDVGAGTGRAVQFLKEARPHLRIVGIEPVDALVREGHRKGLSTDQLCIGDATRLPFQTEEFDLVCEFAVLHHVREPKHVVSEMLRVARKGIFLSDSNRFGQGSRLARVAKHALRITRLWPVANFLKTRGKGYLISEGDGLYYSYSVLDSYSQIRSQCSRIHLMNTVDATPDLVGSSPHIALFGLK